MDISQCSNNNINITRSTSVAHPHKVSMSSSSLFQSPRMVVVRKGMPNSSNNYYDPYVSMQGTANEPSFHKPSRKLIELRRDYENFQEKLQKKDFNRSQFILNQSPYLSLSKPQTMLHVSDAIKGNFQKRSVSVQTFKSSTKKKKKTFRASILMKQQEREQIPLQFVEKLEENNCLQNDKQQVIQQQSQHVKFPPIMIANNNNNNQQNNNDSLPIVGVVGYGNCEVSFKSTQNQISSRQTFDARLRLKQDQILQQTALKKGLLSMNQKVPPMDSVPFQDLKKKVAVQAQVPFMLSDSGCLNAFLLTSNSKKEPSIAQFNSNSNNTISQSQQNGTQANSKINPTITTTQKDALDAVSNLSESLTTMQEHAGCLGKRMQEVLQLTEKKHNPDGKLMADLRIRLYKEIREKQMLGMNFLTFAEEERRAKNVKQSQLEHEQRVRREIAPLLKVIKQTDCDAINIATKEQRRKYILARFKRVIYQIYDKMRRLHLTSRQLVENVVFPRHPFYRQKSRIFLHAAKTNNLDVMSVIVLKNRFYVHEYDINLQTALHWAAKRGYTEMVLWLCLQKADVSQKDIKGKTPLFLASQFKHAECVRVLLGVGASPFQVSNAGRTPMEQVDSKDYTVLDYYNKAKELNCLKRMVAKQKRGEFWADNALLKFFENDERILLKKLLFNY